MTDDKDGGDCFSGEILGGGFSDDKLHLPHLGACMQECATLEETSV